MSCQPCGCDPEANDYKCQRHYVDAQFIPSTTHPQGQNWVGHKSLTNPAFEERIVDKTTGGEKGSKLARFDLVPSEAMWALAEVYGRGARKYADRNWEKGYAWGLSVAALERHLHLWKQGESIDEETGCHHLMQVAWHAVALFIFELRKLGADDVRLSR